MAADLREFARNGWLNIAGGCCGTTPAHIRAIAEAVRGLPPHVLSKPRALHAVQRPRAAGDSPGHATSSTSASAPTSPARRNFPKLILDGEYEEALAVARQQVEGGAQIIDVNMDEAMLDSEQAMTTFLHSHRLGAGHRPRADHGRQLASGT